MSKQYTIAEASEVLGISTRAVKHYRAIYTTEVIKETDGRVFLTQKFIDKVEKTRALDKNKFTDSRTKTELLKLIDDQEKEIIDLKDTVSQYENSEVFEKSDEGLRVEVFTKEDYNLFSERLIEWRFQRKQIEESKEHFSSLKEERDFLKGQFEYLKLSNDKILSQHERLIELISQRNRIEAVKEGVIPREPRDV
jgi:hypothetical protein